MGFPSRLSDRCGDGTYPVDSGMRIDASNKDIIHSWIVGCVGLGGVIVGFWWC